MSHGKVQLSIDRFIRYLELLREGTWRQFDAAAKESVPGLTQAFTLADRLASLGLLEFRWQDRSWQFAPATFVQGRIPKPPSWSRQHVETRWRIFGGSWETAASYLEAKGLAPLRERVQIELPRRSLYFDRCAISIDDPRALLGEPNLGLVNRWDLKAAFLCLPRIGIAAQNWVGEAEEVDAAVLRGAAHTEKSDSNGDWQPKTFDNSFGFWRVDGTPRRYYRVAGAFGRMNIVRTPPDLGRWFDATQPGTMTFKENSEAMVIELHPKVMDLPIVYERWLMLWGCHRRLLSDHPYIVSFERIDRIRARSFARLLSLKEVA